MGRDPRVANAFKAMKAMGITEAKIKPVLKHLLKIYDKNWELIEAENYRVLADAIFEEEDNKTSEQQDKLKDIDVGNYDTEPLTHQEPVPPLKRLRRGLNPPAPPSPIGNSSPRLSEPNLGNYDEEPLAHKNPDRPYKRRRPKPPADPAPPSPIRNSSPRSSGTLLKRPKLEDDELPASSSQKQSQDKGKSPESNAGNVRAETQRLRHKGKEPYPPQGAHVENRRIPESGILLLPKSAPTSQALIRPKDEPFTDDVFANNTPQFEVPLAVIPPDSLSKGDSAAGNVLIGAVGQEQPASQHAEGEHRVNGVLASSTERISNGDLAMIHEESSPNLEIASSSMGEVKISLSCNSALGRQNFHMPSLNELRELMEERCLRSYKIIDPNFSVMNLMKDVCDCFLELATTNPSNESQDRVMNVTPAIDQLKKSTPLDAAVVGGSKENLYMPSGILNGSVRKQCSAEVAPPQISRPLQSLNGMDNHVETTEEIVANGAAESDKEEELKDPECSNGCLMLVPQCQLTPGELRAINDIKDITKGEERVEIPWFNEINKEFPPSFHYISQSLIFQNARVNLSLARIGAENCCSDCFGNCLSSDIVCACAHQTGRFVYTPEGRVEEEFLDECISLTRDSQQQRFLNCKTCPVERARNEGILESCKGHLKRNIIKECWSKCGCNKQCGNRVVQRGIKSKLQVFLTSDGKGWGLRTLEKLQKGAFVCEFVGEIVTITEFFQRNTTKHNCPALLDAYWVSEGVSKDEEALCLDATSYGNVARFLNHRCFDANLIEIPVQIETPDHNYYHLAFFTAREVEPFEELTWDYGIDFDDHDHLVKTFQCRCGSKFCRNMKRSSRSRSLSAAR